MMRTFKAQAITLGVVWGLALLFLVVDLVGPVLGAPPPASAVVSTQSDQSSDQGNPTTPTGNALSSDQNNSRGGKNTNKKAPNASSAGTGTGAGPLYQYTRMLPPALSQSWFYHFFFYPLPLLGSLGLFFYIRSIKKRQRQRQAEVADNSVTVLIGPPIEDSTPWDKAWSILQSWHNTLASLPQNEAGARQKGYGLHCSFGVVSRVGEGMRMTARIPSPRPVEVVDGTIDDIVKAEVEAASAASAGDTPNSKQGASSGHAAPKEGNAKAIKEGKANKPKPKSKKARLAEIAPGLTGEFLGIIRSVYEFAQLWAMPHGYDPLDLDTVKDKRFTERRKTIQDLYQGYRLLQLSGASHLPIQTDFPSDPTALLYQLLDLRSSFERILSACGVELVIVPATQWQQENEQLKEKLAFTLEREQLALSQATSSFSGGSSGKGGSGPNPARAAKSRKSQASLKAQLEAVETRSKQRGAFGLYIYVWAEGERGSVEDWLEQITTRYYNQYTTAPSPATGGQSNRLVVVEQGTGLTKVRERSYPIFFGPQPSVVTAQELGALFHLPNDKIRGAAPERAGAMSPPPELPIIHRMRLPNGKIIKADDQWRRIIGTYRQEDGTLLEIGITEQGCLRSMQQIGRPGSGKSVGLESYIVQDARRNDTLNVGKGGSGLPFNSVMALDPNGDFINDTIDRLPDSHEMITAVVDPLDTERVVGLNPMALPSKLNQESFSMMLGTVGTGLSLDFSRSLGRLMASSGMEDGATAIVAGAVIEIFSKTQGVDRDTTPLIYRVISNTIRAAVQADANSNIGTMLRIITDEAYRRAIISRLKDPLARDFWLNQFPNYVKQGGDKLMPALSRLENLVREEPIRRMLNQRVSTLNLRIAADKGHCVLFRLSPSLGDFKSFILAVLFNMIKQAIFSRSDIPKEMRRMCSVYLDEFQEAVGSDPETLRIWLEQARKFGGAVTLAHQNLAQVKTLVEALKGTVGSIIAMLVGVDDRRFFSGQFGSAEWPAAQIARAFDKLPKYAMVAKLFDDGRDYTPVLLNSVPRGKRLAGYDPLLVAVVDPNQPHGYRLESYQPGWHGQALRISETEGMEGFWEPSLPNGAILPEFPLRAPGFIQPATPQFCPNLIEELTTFLYRKGELEWGFTPFDPKAAQVAGYGPEAIDQINRSETDLAAGQKMLMEIENIGDRTEREARLMELSEEEWQLYRGFRKSRDTQLREVIGQHRSLIPEKRNRILTLSRLWVGTPVAEIEAERLRPDIFSIEAEAIREEMLAEAEAEEAAKQAGKKGRGSGGPKKATVA